MYDFLTKHGTLIAFGLGLLVAVAGLLSVMSGLSEFNALPEEEQGQTTIFNVGLGGAIILVILCALLMLVFGVMHVASDLKGALEFIGGAVVLIGLIVVFYATTEAETSGKVYEAIQNGELSATTSRWINGAIWTTLILLGLATLAFIVSEIRNIFR